MSLRTQWGSRASFRARWGPRVSLRATGGSCALLGARCRTRMSPGARRTRAFLMAVSFLIRVCVSGTRRWIHWRYCYQNHRTLDFTPPARYCWRRQLELGQLRRAQHDVEPLGGRSSRGSSRTQSVCSGRRSGLLHVNFHHNTTRRGSRRHRSSCVGTFYPFLWTSHTTRATSLAHVRRLL